MYAYNNFQNAVEVLEQPKRFLNPISYEPEGEELLLLSVLYVNNKIKLQLKIYRFILRYNNIYHYDNNTPSLMNIYILIYITFDLIVN